MNRIIIIPSRKLIEMYQSSRGVDIFEQIENNFSNITKAFVIKEKTQAKIIVDCNTDFDSKELRNVVIGDILKLKDNEKGLINVSSYSLDERLNTKYKNPKERLEHNNYFSNVEKVNQIRDRLLAEVIGQSHAVEEIIDYLLFLETFEEKRPHSITLFGPESSGKSYLANAVAHNLEEAFDIPYFVTHKDAYLRDKYVDDVLDFISHNNQCVVVIEDAEEISSDALCCFNEILETGKFLNISCAQVLFIFTSSLGKSIYNTSINSNFAYLKQDEIITSLRREISDISYRYSLNYWFLRNISNDKVVLLNFIDPFDIQIHLSHYIDNSFNDLSKKTGVNYEYDAHDLARLIMFEHSDDYSIKSLINSARNFFSKEFADLYRIKNKNDSNILISELNSIKFEIDYKSSSQAVKQLFGNRKYNILFYSTHIKLAKDFTSQLYEIVIAKDSDSFKKALTKDIDFVIIDYSNFIKNRSLVDIHDVPSEENLLFNYMVKYYNDIPLFVLAEKNTISSTELLSFMGKGAKDAVFFDNDECSLLHVLDLIAEGQELNNDIKSLVKQKKVLSHKSIQKLVVSKKNMTIKLSELQLVYSQHSVINGTYKNDEITNTVDEVIGHDVAKRILTNYGRYLEDHNAFYATGGKTPKALLLYGPDGVGKVYLAKGIANDTKSTFVYADIEKIFRECSFNDDSIIQKVSDLFKRAMDNSPSVFVLDNIQFIANENVNETIFKQFLSCIDLLNNDDRKPVLFLSVAQTYSKERINQRYLDKVDRAIYFALPKEEERKELILRFIKDNGLVIKNNVINTFLKRTPYYSYAEVLTVLEFILKNAKGNEISSEEFFDLFDIYNYGDSLDKPEDDIERTAYHEVGHLLVGILLGDRPPIVSIVGRGNFLGYTAIDSHEGKEEDIGTKEAYLNKICRAFAGRAAEVLIYGETGINTGASGDLDHATVYAKQMFTRYGMGENLISYQMIPNKDFAPEVLKEMNDTMKAQFERAYNLLNENKELFIIITQKLVEKRTLIIDEIEEIISNYKKNKK